jgi:hypothetical protein
LQLPLLAASITAKIVLNSLTVRIHTGISGNTWTRLWYLCRALDDGTGHIKVPMELLQTFLEVNQTSIYRWLAEGKKLGAFRHYKVRTGEIWLGSLFVVSRNLNLKVWGFTAIVPLCKILTLSGMRATTTAVVTEKLQQRSRYAASTQLKPKFREFYPVAHPSELFGETKGQSSHKTEAGQLPICVLHVSDTRIWVSKGFTHFGTSQHAVSLELGIHPRTVRRHQGLVGMERRQLCQKKSSYNWIKRAWEHETEEYYLDKIMLKATGTGSDAGASCIGYSQIGDKVRFTDGIPLGAKKRTPNSYDIPAAEFGQRFFKMGDDTWINRCNIYQETHKLTTMRAAKRKYRQTLAKQGIEANCHTDIVPAVEKIEPVRRDSAV